MTSSASKQSVWPIDSIEWRHVDDVFCLTRRQRAVGTTFIQRQFVHSSIRASTERSTGNRRRITGRNFKPFRGLSSKSSRKWSVYEKDVKRYSVGELSIGRSTGKDIRRESDVSQRTKDPTAAYIGDAFLRCRVLERRSRELTFQGSRLITGKPDPFHLNLWVRTSWLIDRTTVWLNPFYL